MRLQVLGPASLVLLFTSLAHGADPEPGPAPPPPPPGPPPYTAWQGTSYGGPGGVVAPPAPPPAVGEAVYARRTVELVPALSLALPNCRAGSATNDRCDGVTTGGGLGFVGLWRVTPYFAWGGGFEFHGFQYDPPEDLQLSEASAGAVWIGFIGRVYFADEGSIDPYVQLGLGVGALGTTTRDAAGVRWEETGAGPAAQLSGGLDFFLSRSLKLGPALSYTRVFVDKIRRCRASGDGDCVDVSKDENGHLNSYLAVSVRLSILLGGEH